MSLKTFLRIGEANKEIARLTDELAKAKTASETLVSEHEAAVTEMQNLATERDQKIEALETELKESKEKVTKLEGEAKTASQRAAQIVAQTGTAAVEAPTGEQAEQDPEAPKTSAEAWDAYAKLGSATDRRAFYDKHRALMNTVPKR